MGVYSTTSVRYGFGGNRVVASFGGPALGFNAKFYWQSGVRDGQQVGACMEEEGILLDDPGAA